MGSGTTYYVDPAGNDMNNGRSTATPWQTIAKVNQTSFTPGDRVLFKGGQSFSGNLQLGADDRGTPADPISLGSYGTGRAAISAGTGPGVYAYNTAGLEIGNLTVLGSGRASNTADGIVVYNDLPANVKLDYVRVYDLEVSGFGKGGVSIGGSNGLSGFKNVYVTGVSAHDNARVGIQTFGPAPTPTSTGYANENVYIGNCRTFNNPGVAGLATNTGSGILIGGTNGATVERNVAYGNGALNTAVGGPVGIWTYDSNRVTIQFNESYGNRTNSTADGGGFDIDGGVTNSVMQYNYSHDNDGAGFLVAQYEGARPLYNNAVRYNISQNDGRKNGYAGIQLYGKMDTIDIYSNTVFMGSASTGAPSGLLISQPGQFTAQDGSQYTIGPVSNARVLNNIFYTSGGPKVLSVGGGNQGLVFQGNRYYATNGTFKIGYGGSLKGNVYSGVVYDSLNAWRSATGQEKRGSTSTGSQGNPQLVNPGGGGTINNAYNLNTLGAYQLTNTSPVKDNGLNLSALFGITPGSTDFYGNAIPQGSGYSVGAHDR